jgi:hypothetical protein
MMVGHPAESIGNRTERGGDMLTSKSKLIGIGILLSVSLAACNLSSTPGSSSPIAGTAEPGPATKAPAALPAKTSDEVIAAVKTAEASVTKATGPRLIILTMYKGDTVESVMEGQFVPPDTLYQKMTAGGQIMAESYWYHGTIYSRSPASGGKWVASPGALSQFTQILGGVVSGVASSIVYSDGKVLGEESVHGDLAIVYGYTTELKGLATSKITHKVWVSNATGFPIKEETDRSTEKTVREVTFNANLAITIPAEVLAAPTKN